MTDVEIEAMPAGPEIDAIVCVAADIDPDPRMVGDGSGRTFSPSTDWNAAMYAAERFGLFDMPILAFTDNDRHSDCDETVHGEAPTGPLVICRAILKLARKETT